MKIKQTVTKTVTEEVEVELPLFFGADYSGVAFIETSQIKWFRCGDRISLIQDKLSVTELKSNLEFSKKVTEEEFMEKYQTIQELLSLTPKLIFK